MFCRTSTGVVPHQDHFSACLVGVVVGAGCDVCVCYGSGRLCDGGSVSGSVTVLELPVSAQDGGGVLLQSVELSTCPAVTRSITIMRSHISHHNTRLGGADLRG